MAIEHNLSRVVLWVMLWTMSEERAGRDFYFIGERLCLDFVNTEAAEEGTAVDLLADFDDFVAWCGRAEMIAAAQGKELLRRWSGTREPDRTFKQAVDVRAALRAMMERLADGRHNVTAATLALINDILRTRAGHLELARKGDGYDMRFRQRFEEPADLLVPIAESAADLLSHGDLTLVKKCQNARCILFFYDTTKNHARRWCSMSACGNRAKVAAHYRRARQDTTTS
jgi:predicted RNA-binding Zn ribbon-like protein